jgi:hypothetical protein
MPLVFRLHCYTQISSQRPQLCPHFCLSLSMTGRIEDSHPASPHVNIMMLQIIAHKACTAIVAIMIDARDRERERTFHPNASQTPVTSSRLISRHNSRQDGHKISQGSALSGSPSQLLPQRAAGKREVKVRYKRGNIEVQVRQR